MINYYLHEATTMLKNNSKQKVQLLLELIAMLIIIFWLV